MAFDLIETTPTTPGVGLRASVSLKSRGKQLPIFRISFSNALAERLAIASTDRFVLLLGTSEHQGLARLKRSKSSRLAPNFRPAGGVSFNCGHIERFGTEDEKKQYCRIEIIDADTVEITLPPWALEQDV